MSLINKFFCFYKMTYNDMPGGLRDKIRLLDVLNKILRNNSFIDADEINSTILDLKNKVNTLLSNVLGLEYDIDGVYNYDDGPLQNQITELKGNLVDFVNDIRHDINSLSAQLTGINSTSSKISLTNGHEIDTRVDVGELTWGQEFWCHHKMCV
jgi:methyl-accepting chemotaxis protein